MLDALLGFSMAMVVIAGILFITIGAMRLILGNIGTALILTIIAGAMAWMGWKWLAFNDNLALQMLGWAIPSALIFGALMGVRALVNKRNAEPAKPEILGVSEPMA